MNSGYNSNYRWVVVKAAVDKYNGKLERMANGEREFYRNRKERNSEKEANKYKDKAGWFDKTQNIACLFVPPTPEGQQAKLLRKTLNSCRTPDGRLIKVIEEGGVSLKQLLQKSDHNPRKSCVYDDCPICTNTANNTNNSLSRCQVHSVGYEIRCLECQDEGLKAIYYGETSKNGYIRGKQHLSDQLKDKECSVMSRHSKEFHNNKLIGWTMNIVNTFKSAMDRQIDEAVRINSNSSKADIVINNKAEWNAAISITR